MRTLALGSLLFCGLAALLGYVATSGVGMRTTGFSEPVVDNIPVPPHKTVAPAPEVEIKAMPLATTPAVATPATSKPVAVRVSRKQSVTVKPPTAKSEAPQDISKQAVALAPEAPRAKHPTPKPPFQARSVRTHALNFTVDSQPSSQDASQDMQRDKDAERQWREQTLARWRDQEQQQATATRENGEADHSLDGTAVDGFYKAEPEKKPKKKRHRFLFIRW